MSEQVRTLYLALTELVRKAAGYLKIGNAEKSQEVMEEIEELAEGVGLDNFQVQFPPGALMRRDLETRVPGMETGYGECEILRYVAEIPDADSCQELHLEIWNVSREKQIKTGYVGQLFAVRIKWGHFTIRLNIIAAREEFVTGSRRIATIETGDGLAYVVNQFDWATFRIFANDDVDEVTPGKRILYMCVLDREYFNHVDVEMFSQWTSGMVLDQMEAQYPGMTYRRFTAAEAGLVLLDQEFDCEDENLLQSPTRNPPGPSGAEEREEVEVQMEEGVELRSEEELAQGESSTNNNGEEKDRDGEEHILDAKNAAGETVKLTAHQLRMVLGLLIQEASPEKPEAEVDEMARNVDLTEMIRKTNEGLRRSRAARGEPEKDPVENRMKALGIEDGNEELGEEPEGEDDELVNGREMWSTDEESEVREDERMFEISGISSLPALTDSSKCSGLEDGSSPPLDWSPLRRPGINDSGEPNAKRMRRMNMSETSCGSVSLRDSIIMSPELVKVDDGRPILNVSTSSSVSLSPDSINRGEYLRRYLESQRGSLRNLEDRPVEPEEDDLLTGERVDVSDIYGAFPSPGDQM